MERKDLTNGKEIKIILFLTLPLVGSGLLQFLYNFIDMLFVGRLGPEAIAAVGSASFFINLGYSLQAMIAIGASIIIAQSLGKRDDEGTSAFLNTSLVMSFFFGIITICSLTLFGNQLLNFLELNNDIVQKNAYRYLVISSVMLFFAYYNILITRIFSSFGNNKQSFYINSLGLVLNITLDPLFIYTFKFGVLGAALATLCAQIVMFILFLYVARNIIFRKNILQMSFLRAREIISLGLPVSIQRVLFTVISIILARFIITYGTGAVAAQKIGLQIESITYVIIAGLNGAVSSFAGQNFGAKKFKRILTGYYRSLLLGGAYAFVITLLFICFADGLAKLFTNDPETIKFTVNYLKIIGLSQIFMTMEMVGTGVFTGIGLPKIPATISIVFTLMRIPIAMLLMTKFGLDGIWISIAVSSLLKGFASFLVLNILYRRKYVRAF